MGCAEGKAIGEDMTKEELIKQQIQRIEALENEVASLETELAIALRGAAQRCGIGY